jgi:hypothetical protein
LLARTKCRSLVSLGMTSLIRISGTASPLTQGENKSLPSLDAVPERLGEENKVKRRLVMYTGTLIDELISTVERTEKQAHTTGDSQEAKVPYWYVATERERAFDSKLLGVA